MKFVLLLTFLPLQLLACDLFVVLLVEAPHFNLSSNRSLCKSIAKHPSNWSKNGDVGHAWIYLQGRGMCVEGGHSGELGVDHPTYFQGIMQRCYAGDPNPASYLWSSLEDGFFQRGSGEHCPTYAIALKLNDNQFDAILDLVNRYDFTRYSLTEHQCCSFVQQVAERAGLRLDACERIALEPEVRIGGEKVCLWSDLQYAYLEFESPDRLERAMQAAVQRGEATPALNWYKRHLSRGESFTSKLIRFPARLARFLAL